MFIEVSNFLENADKIREYAVNSDFSDLVAFDGEIYKRVLPYEVKGLHEAVEKHIGPILMLGQGFRLNYKGEEPNNGIHTDVNWGTHALVLYLSKCPDDSVETGTAFFDSTGSDAKMLALCKEEFNKAVIYRSDTPHSRWPLEAYGDSPNNGRLIAVAFFTPLSEL